MDWLTLIGTALALAMDAFAVSAAVAATLPALTGRHTFRLAWHFGLFQFLMPVIGWAAGSTLAQRLAAVDHWIAFGLLALLGGRMIWSSFSGRDEREPQAADPTRGWSLVLLAVATSIDALAVGVSLGFLRVSIWLPSVVIGLITGAVSFVGTRLGRRVGQALGDWAERIGGLVLIGIGVRILISHLWGAP
jgi:manganese efflux pump family protein